MGILFVLTVETTVVMWSVAATGENHAAVSDPVLNGVNIRAQIEPLPHNNCFIRRILSVKLVRLDWQFTALETWSTNAHDACLCWTIYVHWI